MAEANIVTYRNILDIWKFLPNFNILWKCFLYYWNIIISKFLLNRPVLDRKIDAMKGKCTVSSAICTVITCSEHYSAAAYALLFSGTALSTTADVKRLRWTAYAIPVQIAEFSEKIITERADNHGVTREWVIPESKHYDENQSANNQR